MLLKDIEPFVRQAIKGGVDNKLHKSDTFRKLQAPDHRLFYIIDGSGTFTVQEKEFALKPSAAIIVQSGMEYIWNTEHARFIAINFDFTQDSDHIRTPFHPIHSENFDKSSIIEQVNFDDIKILNQPVYIPKASFIEYTLQAMLSAYALKEPLTQELLSAYMKSVIIALAHSIHATISDGANTDTARKIISYIQQNYHKNITNADIAEAFHFNPSYANRVFKQSTGVSIHKFLIDYRINIAKELLRTQDTAVNSIALSVGFSDPINFMKYFKKTTGQTPSEYRKSSM